MPRATFRDTGETWDTFAVRCLVECPRCAGRAHVRALEPASMWKGEWRFVCAACGLAKSMTTNGRIHTAGSPKNAPPGALIAAVQNPPIDPAFQLPLWLQTPCRSHTLWTYNAEHIDFLERYISADLREGPTPTNNSTLASRLPCWMIDAQHRDDVLRALAHLRTRALDDPNRSR